ncbi:TRAP transporter small permease [Aliiglaciecola lipolytica]|uniref:TRAP transporter small permease protein n=1 Tax=Aliiglaciecola lipolytica E3 TaxID=1127673 RepID=K6YCV2_9ALTE|nr:TRAP transporter small permease [Aliiglaciecola lipolytica]GAC14458.1 hypothetical protein GLIP_1829 [Aliiglaciecola lipolytica E3]
MRTLIRFVDKLLAGTLILAMLGILLAVVWQVISRYLLKDPASVTEELSRFILIWVGILGAAYAYRQKSHLGFNLLVQKLSPKSQQIMLTIVELLVILFSTFVLMLGGKELVVITLELDQISASLGVKMGLIYTVLPITGVLFVLYSIINIYNLWIADSKESL